MQYSNKTGCDITMKVMSISLIRLYPKVILNIHR